MFEKVSPMHPDKVADRIAGAIVDMAYRINKKPKIAIEILIGHGICQIIIESDTLIKQAFIKDAVWRISKNKNIQVEILTVPQDKKLSDNQADGFKCGDNGIFKGMPLTNEEIELANVAKDLYKQYGSDGKYIIDNGKLTICQSWAPSADLRFRYENATVNPLGDWIGGLDTDSGAINRKIGSDMGGAATGGGLHGKDLSKADVSVNIYAFLKAQRTGKPVELCCSIGDEMVDGLPYAEIVETAHDYIKEIGGFEKFAEWGLIR